MNKYIEKLTKPTEQAKEAMEKAGMTVDPLEFKKLQEQLIQTQKQLSKLEKKQSKRPKKKPCPYCGKVVIEGRKCKGCGQTERIAQGIITKVEPITK